MNHSDEINEDEVFEKKESKLKIGEFFKNKIIITILVIILILAILVTLQIKTSMISNLFSRNQVGNSIGNIINCGYSVEKDDTIYYVSPDENMYATQISRVKKGSNESQIIYQGAYDIRALNIVGNKLYFISISAEHGEDEDGIDNKIYKMDLDGSNLTVINDNEFAYDYYDMHIIKNNIYYVGTDFNVYKMNLNGENRQLVVETGTGYLAINHKYIIYNKDNEDGSDYITYIRPLNGTEERAITSSRITSPILYKEYIYYINSDKHLAKMAITGGDEKELTDYTVYNMNIANDSIYYLNYKNEESENYSVSIFKLGLDGGEPEEIKELSNYSSFLNIIDCYVYYMDMNEEKAFINLINLNDSKEIQLHEWNYKEG